MIDTGAPGADRSISFGYYLLSEQHTPNELVRLAQRAEEGGFDFLFVSDHFHPWIDRQGQSSFVWSVIGAIAQVTSRVHVATAVTCPLFRTHPAIVAQAAATSASLLNGRFMLGLGSGENLNEHILGQRWPSARVRLEMLEEAIGVIRKLLRGGICSHDGKYFTVESARIYSLPDEPPPILVAAGASRSLALAARAGDGLVSSTLSAERLVHFDEAGGLGKPRFGGPLACWARSEAEARRIACEWWPTSCLSGELHRELPLPRHFEQVASIVTEEDITYACGPDPEHHLAAISEWIDAGYDHIVLSQAGPNQEDFLQFAERELLPVLRSRALPTR
jgi:G6PDH family F420-dependent oxidoreductase